MASPLLAAVQRDQLEAAARVLSSAVAEGRVDAASLYVRKGPLEFARGFGAARSADAIFLLASISKPISVAALMTLCDRGAFRLDDPVQRFLPEFTGGGRERITISQLLTHVSGLPDQLPENASLRQRHAPLQEFVERAIRTPLLFAPGSRYQYSSMAILLAAEVAERISGQPFAELVDAAVLQPLGMTHSALGLGPLSLDDTMRCQTENAARESGAGDPSAKAWDWNSRYWRELAAPWGGAHGSAPDVARFLAEFLHPEGKVVAPETARRMVRNHHPAGLPPRGLGFALGTSTSSPRCSAATFGHTGSTGTLAWADPATDTLCVVLTSLPATAADPHPRRLASDRVAELAAS